MIAALTNHLWQSTLFALAAGLVAAGLRRNRASIRHGVWMIASVKFLVPFSLLIGLGAWLAPARASRPAEIAAPSTFSVALDQIVQPFSAAAVATPGSTSVRRMSWMPAIAVTVWMLGFYAIGVARVRHWRRVRAAVRASVPLTLPPALDRARVRIRSTADRFEPGVVGVFRPTLLMPIGIEERLTPSQLDAIVAHELCHVRRRDNLTALMHMTVEALVWFHPLVWWIGARLMRERERACDEHVLRELGAPQAYAEGIVRVCRLYVESPIACVSGVTGSDLPRRLEAITMNVVGATLTPARKTWLVSTATAALCVPIVIGMMTAPLRASAASSARAQDQTPPRKFDVASIKPCAPEALPPGARTGGGSGSFSINWIHLNCFIVKNLIDSAYVGQRRNANDRDPNDPMNNWPGIAGIVDPSGPQRIRGGPAWVYSDKYTIEAKADGLDPTQQQNPDRNTMLGPMLRALLENRFQLKLHEETEEVPMFALTVAKGGLKIKPMPEGGCTKDRSNGPVTLTKAKREGLTPTCGTVLGDFDGPNFKWEHSGQTLGVVANVVSGSLGVKVLDRTGVKDIFSFTWTYLPDEATPGDKAFRRLIPEEPSSIAPAATIFKALEEQLGLKLEPIKGTRGYLVIDHIERPTPNDLEHVDHVGACRSCGGK